MNIHLAPNTNSENSFSAVRPYVYAVILIAILLAGCAATPQERECRERSYILVPHERTTARTTCTETMGCRTTFTKTNYRRVFVQEVYDICLTERVGQTP